MVLSMRPPLFYCSLSVIKLHANRTAGDGKRALSSNRHAVYKRETRRDAGEGNRAAGVGRDRNGRAVIVPDKVPEACGNVGAEDLRAAAEKRHLAAVANGVVPAAAVQPVFLGKGRAVQHAEEQAIPRCYAELLERPHKREKRRPAVERLRIHGIRSFAGKGVIVFKAAALGRPMAFKTGHGTLSQPVRFRVAAAAPQADVRPERLRRPRPTTPVTVFMPRGMRSIDGDEGKRREKLFLIKNVREALIHAIAVRHAGSQGVKTRRAR